jgi:hypothetical protein
VDLLSRNPATGQSVLASLNLTSDYDRADPDELNRGLRAALKPGTPMRARFEASGFGRTAT